MIEKILAYIGTHPGCRQREIAVSLRIWQCDPFLMGALADLEDLGKIKREVYSDPAQMEYYNKWYLTGA